MKAVLTRNMGTWSEAKHFGGIRSALRKLYQWNWLPKKVALERARRRSQSANKRLKWEFQCASCREWFPREDVAADHVVPCGSLKSYADVGPFLERMLPESPDGFQVLCDECHNRKTQAEAAERRAAAKS